MRFAAIALIALCASSVQAAVINIKPSLVKVFDAAFNDITSTAIDGINGNSLFLNPDAAGGTYTLQVDLSFTIGDLQPTELGFGNAAFNIGLDGQMTQSAAAPGWNPESGKTVDKNGAAPGGIVDKWADNGDYGVSGDLQGMVIGTDPPGFGPVDIDPRRAFGKNGDEYFGTVFLDFPGVAGSTGGIYIEGAGGSTYDANNKLVAAGTTVTGGALNFQLIPEPSSAVLMGLSGILVVACGRRLRC